MIPEDYHIRQIKSTTNVTVCIFNKYYLGTVLAINQSVCQQLAGEMQMKKTKKRWIEIISVRLFNIGHQNVIHDIFNEVNAGRCPVPDKAVAAELYANHHVETDWSIYLYRSVRDAPPSKTRLGLNIAEAFSSLGLVNHSVWIMDLIKKETHHEEKKRN
jgi:hypothetical protein